MSLTLLIIFQTMGTRRWPFQYLVHFDIFLVKLLILFFFIRTVDTNTVEFYLCIMSIELVEFYFFVNTLRKIYEAATDLSTWPGNLVFHLANKLIVAQRSLDASISCTSSIHLLFSGWHKLEHTKYFQAYLWKVRVAEYNTFIVNLVL